VNGEAIHLPGRLTRPRESDSVSRVSENDADPLPSEIEALLAR
jgi:hypothetical protein